MRGSSNPFVIIIGWLVSAIAAVWMELAGGVGYVARRFGDSARELDPAHRRDGAGLAVLAATVVAVLTAWWRLGSPLGRALTALIRGTFGIMSWTLPVLLALLAWRLLRHPDKNAHAGRMVIGWTAFLAGVLGIVHIALGSPGLSDGVAAMQTSGGLIGYAISAPLQALLTTWAAVPLLALIAAFGVLVITGTPLHRVPERFAEFVFLIRGGVTEVAEDGAEAGPAGPAAARLGRRKNSAAIEAGEHDRPYDTPLLGGLVPRGAAGRAARASQAAAAVDPGTGAETAAQAGVPAHRSMDDEVIAEALMFGTSQAGPDAGPRGYPGRGPAAPDAGGYGAGRAGAASGGIRGGIRGRGVLAQVVVRRRRPGGRGASRPGGAAGARESAKAARPASSSR